MRILVFDTPLPDTRKTDTLRETGENMSKVSGFDLGLNEFQIPASRMTGQDGAVQIPRQVVLNEKSSVMVIREVQSSAESFNKKLSKIRDLVSSIEVDKDTDTVMMDSEFLKKLSKLVDQAQNDFNKIINAAS